MNELRPGPGSRLAVLGTGNVGLAAIMAARLTGATTIIAVDTEAHRLALARELGATHVIQGDDRLTEQLKEASGGGLDYAIEATNGANLVAAACEALAIRGTCAVVGGAKGSATIKLNHPDTLLHGKRLIGVLGGGGQTPQFHLALMRLQAQGRFPIERLVQYFPFADINDAIQASDDGRVVKPILRMM